MTTAPRILVLSAGTSVPSSTRILADQLSAATGRLLESTGIAPNITTVELREIARDITAALLSPFPGERVAGLIEQISAADAVIVVTPIYNTGPSGLLKTLIDAIDPEVWRDKPVLLGATAGTPRHSLAIEYAIRPIFVYLKARIVPTAVFASSGDFGAQDSSEAGHLPLATRTARAGAELVGMVDTRTSPRDAAEGDAGAERARPTTEAEHAASGPTPPSATGRSAALGDFTPMDQLLRRR